jgi:hypothetical protein
MSGNPTAATGRRLVHTREIVCTGYARDDGLYDIEARMIDTKGHHSNLLFKEVPVGGAIHDMRLTITVDERLVIRAAHAHTHEAPTPWCAQIESAYARLVGIGIGSGFMREVKARLGGTRGCTHLSELLGPMATTAFQTIMGLKNDPARAARDATGEGEREAGGTNRHALLPPPLPLLDTCHAWRADGRVVQIVRKRGQPSHEAGDAPSAQPQTSHG